jgi:hypothetical protein
MAVIGILKLTTILSTSFNLIFRNLIPVYQKDHGVEIYNPQRPWPLYVVQLHMVRKGFD